MIYVHSRNRNKIGMKILKFYKERSFWITHEYSVSLNRRGVHLKRCERFLMQPVGPTVRSAWRCRFKTIVWIWTVASASRSKTTQARTRALTHARGSRRHVQTGRVCAFLSFFLAFFLSFIFFITRFMCVCVKTWRADGVAVAMVACFPPAVVLLFLGSLFIVFVCARAVCSSISGLRAFVLLYRKRERETDRNMGQEMKF